MAIAVILALRRCTLLPSQTPGWYGTGQPAAEVVCDEYPAGGAFTSRFSD